jgi:hypothetical protein
MTELRDLTASSDGSLRTRQLEKHFEEGIASLAKALDSRAGSGIDPDEAEAALSLVSEMVQPRLPVLFSTAAINSGRGYIDLVEEVQPLLEQALFERHFSDAAAQYARSALGQASFAVVNWARGLPGAIEAATWAQAEKLEEISRNVNEILQVLLEDEQSQRSSFSGLVEGQRRQIATSLSSVSLLSLDVADRYNYVPIEAAMILSRVQTEEGVQAFPKAIQRAMEKARASNCGMRLLIEGTAGSGKTTLAQWLAFKAAVGSAGIEVSPELSHTFISFVRMRELFSESQPRLLDQSLLVDTTAMHPPAWLDEIAKSWPLLLVLDGWDEVPQQSRAAARDWLEAIMARFPQLHCLITARPEGAPPTKGFHRAEMLPLNEAETERIVHGWYDGLALGDPSDLHWISDGSRGRLLQDLKVDPLSRLAETPLLVAMLCALYAAGEQVKATNRYELFDLLTAALLKRDSVRRIENRWSRLRADQRLGIVKRVAYKMARNGVYSVPITGGSREPDSIEVTLRDNSASWALPENESSLLAEEVVKRSLVFNVVGSDKAEFKHRDIRDYLAAGYLRSRSDSTGVMQICLQTGSLALASFSVYTATIDFADRILNAAADHVDDLDPGSPSRRLWILGLLQCASSATEKSEAAAARALSLAGEVLPPRNQDEIQQLAEFGDPMIPLLTANQFIGNSECLQALACIASDAALEGIRAQVIQGHVNADAMARSWEQCPRFQELSDCFSHVQGKLELRITDELRTAEARKIPNISSLTLTGVEVQDALSGDFPSLRTLLLDNISVNDASAILPTTPLRAATLFSVRGIVPSELAHPKTMTHLHLIDSQVDSLSRLLERQPNLRVLWIDGQKPVSLDPSALRGLKSLVTLHLGSNTAMTGGGGLACLEDMEQLRKLHWSSSFSTNSLAALSDKPLRELKIGLEVDYFNLAMLDRTTPGEAQYDSPRPSTRISRDRRELDIGTPLASLPLTKLSISTVAVGIDGLDRLGNVEQMTLRGVMLNRALFPPRLAELTLEQCVIEAGASFEGVDMVKSLTIRDSEMDHLAFLSAFSAVETLFISSPLYLESLDGLAGMRAVRTVTISNAPNDIQTSDVDKLKARGCAVAISYGHHFLFHQETG